MEMRYLKRIGDKIKSDTNKIKEQHFILLGHVLRTKEEVTMNIRIIWTSRKGRPPTTGR